ncbi:DMT family transporter [Methylocystis sp. L43]|jgi:drug/metabolite transporter (DMT)-like permease|uniref:DMT family transporter n=1 Tax=unclassified Methylocystis TaxID=2625913 RepID=UPI0018C1F510|nr:MULTISPECIES: DMT family transporter [unclassified Methylocystis]MBG0798784.1 DMT family transporter [Methylocystis sp. L43]MBG0806291.1 DMT family transporter [Methylocystis sp. H15]
MSRLRADLLLVLAAFIWGTAFIAQKNAGELMGPITFVGVRFLLSCAALVPLALYESRHSESCLKKGDLALAGLIGLCVFLAAALQQVGLATTTATNGGFLTALYVVLVPVFVFAQTGVRPRQVVLVAGLGSIVGAWLLTDSGQLQSWTSGDALVLIADIAWAAGISLVPTFLARANRPYFLAFAQFGVIGVLGTVVGLGGEPFSLEGLIAALPSILYAGLCSGGIAFTLQIVALNYTPAAEAALIMSLESVFAALAGVILLSERLTASAMVGGLLILLSAVFVEAGPAAQNIWVSQYWSRLSQVWSRAR